MKFIESPTRCALHPRTQAVKCVVMHTTGTSNLAQCLKFYDDEKGFQPHYCISIGGEIFRIADEGLIAYHAAIFAAEARLYRMGFKEWAQWVWDESQKRPVHKSSIALQNYIPWKQAFWPHQSPLELVTKETPNAVSIGIELQQPEKPGPAIFTDIQYQAAAELTADICKRYGLTPSRTTNFQTIMGHSDVSPMRRCTARGPWDPGGNFDWPRFLNLVMQAIKPPPLGVA